MPRPGTSEIVGTITDTTPSTAGTATGDLVGGCKHFDWFTIDASIASPTGGTLDVYLQRLVGSTWVDWLHLPQRAAGAAAIRYVIDSNSQEAGPVTVGSGTTPALAAGKFANCHPGDQVRALYVAGASTSAGAAVVITITGFQSAG
jgi:hypothetical protein